MREPRVGYHGTRGGQRKGRLLAELVVLSGACEGVAFPLPEIPTVVGRSPEAHVQIPDPWISSMHAMLERRGDDTWVVDLDSRNGTFLGDERVTEARVPYGARIRFGRTEARLESGHTEEPITLEGSSVDTPRGMREPHRDTIRSDGTISTRNPLAAREPEADPFAPAPRRATVLRMAIDAAELDGLPGAAKRAREAIEAAAAAALDTGGMVSRLAGVGVLALYGLAGPSDDDAERALRAARAARRAVRERGGLDLRAAVDTGPVLAGDAGEHGGFDLVALGPAAERAERLLALAGPGEILAGPGAASTPGLARLGLRAVGPVEIEVFRDEGE